MIFPNIVTPLHTKLNKFSKYTSFYWLKISKFWYIFNFRDSSRKLYRICKQCSIRFFTLIFRYCKYSRIKNCHQRKILISYVLYPFLLAQQFKLWYNINNRVYQYLSPCHNFCSENLPEIFTDSMSWILRLSKLPSVAPYSFELL